MTAKLGTLLVAPLRVVGCLMAASFAIPAGCDVDNSGSTRVLSGLVLQVDVVTIEGKNPVPLTALIAQVAATKPIKLDPKHKQASSQPPYRLISPAPSKEHFGAKGTYYILFPDDFKVTDLQTIAFSMPGYHPLPVDYQNYPRVPYTPTEFTSISPNSKHPCSDYNELGTFKYTLTFNAFIQYVMQHIPQLENSAYAKTPSVPLCHLIFRQREEISITLEPAA